MSPDQYKNNPVVQRLIRTSGNLNAAFPSIAKYIVNYPEDFRGLTMFLGDTAEIVVGLRVFGEDGAPEVCWSSGNTPIEALMNLDSGIGNGKFRDDPPKDKKPKDKGSYTS